MNDKRPNDNAYTNDYDGVIYEKSSAPDKAAQQKTRSKQAPPKPVKKATARKKPPQKSQINVFLAATLFTGIVVCIIVFALIFASFLRDDVSPPPQTENPTASNPNSPPPHRAQSFTGLIEYAGGGKLSIYDFTTDKTLSLNINNLSILSDRFGNPIVFAELSPGDIVEVDYYDDLIYELSLSGEATEYPKTTARIDAELQTIYIGSESFTYNNHLVLGKDTILSEISSIDEVKVRFYKNVIWFIELVRGHGWIEFINAEDVIGGLIEINNNIRRDLEGIGAVELHEGTYRVVVKGENVESFVGDITVERGQTTYVDLSEMKILSGQLIFHVNQPDYKLYIDGDEADPNEPVILPFGEYAVVIEKEGFATWQETVEVEGSLTTVSVELTERVQFCRFTVITIPEGAEVYLDAAYIGMSPVTFSAHYGAHTLTFHKEGYKTLAPMEFTLNTPTRDDPFIVYLQEEEIEPDWSDW